VQIDNEPLVFI